MNVTCALLVITPDERLLLAHPTGAPWNGSWSVPKGLLDPGETPRQAAARECYEETGLDFRDISDSFIDLGRHKYAKDKDYHLFLHRTTELFEQKDLKCITYFMDRNDVAKPEVDSYRLATFESAQKLLNKKQALILAGNKDKIVPVPV